MSPEADTGNSSLDIRAILRPVHLHGFQARALIDLLVQGRVRVILDLSSEVIWASQGHPHHRVPSVGRCVGVDADLVQMIAIHVVDQAILCVIAPQYMVEVGPSHQGR